MRGCAVGEILDSRRGIRTRGAVVARRQRVPNAGAARSVSSGASAPTRSPTTSAKPRGRDLERERDPFNAKAKPERDPSGARGRKSLRVGPNGHTNARRQNDPPRLRERAVGEGCQRSRESCSSPGRVSRNRRTKRTREREERREALLRERERVDSNIRGRGGFGRGRRGVGRVARGRRGVGRGDRAAGARRGRPQRGVARGQLRQRTASNDSSFDSRWCLRVVERSVEASDDRRCCGKPRDLRESLELSIIRIGLETAEFPSNEMQIAACGG